MTPIRYVTGDATAPVGDGPKIVAHVCNDRGGWGRGFVLAVSRRWPKAEAAYRWWHEREAPFAGEIVTMSGRFGLGETQVVGVTDFDHRGPAPPSLWVANMVAQHGYYHTRLGGPPIRYEALKVCLSHVAAWAASHEASVHMPRIGCGLAGGTWDRVEPLVREELSANDVAVTVYDLPAARKAGR